MFLWIKETFKMTTCVANYLGGASSDLPRRVRVTPDGKMVSIIDVITVISFTHDDGRLKSSAQKNASDYNKILIRDHPEVSTLQRNFKFAGQGQRETPVAGRNGMLRIIQLLRGKKAATFRQSMADLLEKYLDADMGLADDITDRALDAHMADLEAKKTRAFRKWVFGEVLPSIRKTGSYSVQAAAPAANPNDGWLDKRLEGIVNTKSCNQAVARFNLMHTTLQPLHLFHCCR